MSAKSGLFSNDNIQRYISTLLTAHVLSIAVISERTVSGYDHRKRAP